MEIKNIETKSMGNFLTITNKQYYLSKHQRAYKWGEKQMLELLDDTFDEFSKYYNENDDIVTDNYKNYKLDNIIIYNGEIIIDGIKIKKDDILQKGVILIVDGQQRITSMTLLYIYLYKYLKELNHKNFNDDIIDDLYNKVVKTQKLRHGEKKYFVLYIEDRKNCMENILKSKINNIEEELKAKEEDTVSVENLKKNYSTINDFFNRKISEIKNENNNTIEEVESDIAHKFGLYARWLMDNVIINIEEADNEDDAFNAFMKKNNRGLGLTEAELIKAACAQNAKNTGFTLSNAIFEDFFNNVRVRKIEHKADGQFNAITSLIRSRLINAKNKKGKIILSKDIDYSSNNDEIFQHVKTDYLDIGKEGIGKGPYNWLLNLINYYNEDFTYDDIVKEVRHFTIINEKIRKSSNEYLRYANNVNIKKTMYDLLFYSAIDYEDNENIINKKIELISKFIEIVSMMDAAFPKRPGHSKLNKNIIELMIAIRNQPINKISKILAIHFEKHYKNIEIKDILKINFCGNTLLAKHILIRISIKLEEILLSDKEFNEKNIMEKYLPYQLEHILPKTPDNNKFYKTFNNEEDYIKCNNEIGNYILLKEGENKKIKNSEYSNKLPIYIASESKIARSLTEEFYDKKINVICKIDKLIKAYPKLKSYKDFTKLSIKERTELYISIAETIWSLNYFTNISEE